jgi:hypothetical protein
LGKPPPGWFHDKKDSSPNFLLYIIIINLLHIIHSTTCI